MINLQTIGIQVLAADQPAPSGAAALLQFLPTLLFGAAIYFFLFAPYRKTQKEREKLQAGLQVGDQVVLSNGIYGKIVQLADDRATIELESGRMVVMRSSIFGKAEDAAKAVQA